MNGLRTLILPVAAPEAAIARVPGSITTKHENHYRNLQNNAQYKNYVYSRADRYLLRPIHLRCNGLYQRLGEKGEQEVEQITNGTNNPQDKGGNACPPVTLRVEESEENSKRSKNCTDDIAESHRRVYFGRLAVLRMVCLEPEIIQANDSSHDHVQCHGVNQVGADLDDGSGLRFLRWHGCVLNRRVHGRVGMRRLVWGLLTIRILTHGSSSTMFFVVGLRNSHFDR